MTFLLAQAITAIARNPQRHWHPVLGCYRYVFDDSGVYLSPNDPGLPRHCDGRHVGGGESGPPPRRSWLYVDGKLELVDNE